MGRLRCCFDGQGVLYAAQSGSLSPPALGVLQGLRIEAARRRIAAPIVISACRSPEQQLELLRRWARGDRVGIAAPPADPSNSRHVPDESGLCWAFDLGNTGEWLAVMGPWATNTYPYVQWGGAWIPRDANHFQIDPHGAWQLAGVWQIR